MPQRFANLYMYCLVSALASVLCFTKISVAQNQVQPTKNALIPLRSADILATLGRYNLNGGQFTHIANIQQANYLTGVRPLYSFRLPDGLRFDVNALTGDVDEIDFEPEEISADEIQRRANNALSQADLQKKALSVINKFYPQPNLLSQITSNVDMHSIDKIEFSLEEITASHAKTLNRCRVTLRRDTGDLTNYSARYRPTEVSTEPSYHRGEVLAIARWAMSGGKPISTQILLLSEFNAEQSAALGREFMGYKDVELYVAEDVWQRQRLVWRFNFNLGNVYIDAHTGKILDIDAWPILPSELDLKSFALPHPVTLPIPKRISLLETSVQSGSVNFNGDEVTGDPDGLINLHYAPIIRNDSPLIFSEYFPKFLINVEAKGTQIILEGQLKDKHKAVIKLGEQKYTLDGKQATFTTPPTKINDRIYLPAELLQHLNGVLIRWEPKKKLLWVDTRYLRR